MAHKPVHIITNDDTFVLQLYQTGLEHVIGSEDYTEEEGLHYHYLINWPVNTATATLSPTRNGAVGRWRKSHNCRDCKSRQSNYKCKTCGLYYKFIWCQSEFHTNNTKKYIERKIEEHPEWDVDAE